MNLVIALDGEELSIEFPDEGVTTSCAVSAVDDHYRLDAVPMLVEAASYGDVIEATVVSPTTLRFVRVVRPGGWHVLSYVLPRDWREAPAAVGVLDEAARQGGHWEVAFGGVVVICLPPGCSWRPPDPLY